MDPDWDDDKDWSPAPDLTVWPTDDEPEPVLYLADGTPLYRHKSAFGFARPEQPPPRPPKPRAIRRRRMR